jgi:hypothetical protein
MAGTSWVAWYLIPILIHSIETPHLLHFEGCTEGDIDHNWVTEKKEEGKGEQLPLPPPPPKKKNMEKSHESTLKFLKV